MSTGEKNAPGAPPPGGFIPLIVPELRGNEWTYVKDCLDTNWVSSVGSYVDRFEKLAAEQAGTKYAVATVNGTSALHIALLVAGVEPDDEVIVSTLTFIAPVNAIRYAGAWPAFIDAEPSYWQMDPAQVLDFVEKRCRWDGQTLRNEKTGRRVRAIMPIHLLGQSVDLDPILAIAKKYALPVIEDATEGLGAQYRNKRLGGIGDAGCFSFNGNKIITTGGGGMFVTNRSDWAARAKYLTTQAKDDPIEYIHHAVGYNYRLTNVLAAIGCAQMEKLDEYVAAKRKIAETYINALSDIPGLTPMVEQPWAKSTFWMYTVLIDPKKFGKDARALLQGLAAKKIQTRPLWQPIHLSGAHSAPWVGSLPVAEQLYKDALSLPCSVGLKEDEQSRVIDAIRSEQNGTRG